MVQPFNSNLSLSNYFIPASSMELSGDASAQHNLESIITDLHYQNALKQLPILKSYCLALPILSRMTRLI